MLVLSRKVGEKVVIDGNITVEIIRVNGKRITIGIEAPANVKILRSELDESNPAKAMTPKLQTMELIVEDGVLVAC